MNAFEARKIINEKFRLLINIEPSWSACSNCPNNGKCCNGASISLYKEEWEPIETFLNMNKRVKNYAKERFKERKNCYFFDPSASQCLIYNVRPLSCLWTPQTLFNAKNLTGFIKNKNCEFTPIEPNRKLIPSEIDESIIKIEPSINEKNINQFYVVFQRIKEIRELMKRNHDFHPISQFMEKL
ncbi:MAG: YkgJ family cysteine cluster protein [Candidatus Omnitrophica bacterium]|nr:YkgJ family cysteine cluster protein [Candidatus Omnitrophota bacterium]